MLGSYVWLDFVDKDKMTSVIDELDSSGLIDKDVDLKFRRIMNESDRDIETETSKINTLTIYRSINCSGYFG